MRVIKQGYEDVVIGHNGPQPHVKREWTYRIILDDEEHERFLEFVQELRGKK